LLLVSDDLALRRFELSVLLNITVSLKFSAANLPWFEAGYKSVYKYKNIFGLRT